jgi:DNA repair protein RadD
MIKLRGIQEEALDGAISSFRSGGTYHLLQAPVAFGKTIFSSALMKHAVDEFGAKCLFLAHLTELVVQTVDKFNAVAPELSCGVVMGSSKDAQDVTIGTRQTVGKNLDLFEKINLIIIDEVHLYGPQYQKIVDHFLEKNPRLRVVGVTGTPFNLKEGWIYGDKKIWPDPFHASTMDQMIDMGYLSPYRYKMAESLDDELQGIKKTAGEFNEGDLGEMMQEEHHMGTVKHAIETYASDRKRIMVFAVTIEHAEKLADFLGCFAVHSKLKKDDWREKVDRFKSGNERILVNVSQLSIGFDCPEVDCVVVARPTMSPALHVQIFGRGMRISEGKKDCLFLDLVGNYLRHGLPSNPKIRKPKEKEDAKEREKNTASVCHECFEIVEDGIVCPYCGAELAAKKEIIERDEALKMKEIERLANIPKVVLVGEKRNSTTKKGFVGSWFWVKLDNGKTIFKFCGNGTAKMERERAKINKLRDGDPINIVSTAYGDWF